MDTVVTDKSIGVSRIATDNELGGEKAAQALAQLGVKGKVLVISTDPASPAWTPASRASTRRPPSSA